MLFVRRSPGGCPSRRTSTQLHTSSCKHSVGTVSPLSLLSLSEHTVQDQLLRRHRNSSDQPLPKIISLRQPLAHRSAPLGVHRQPHEPCLELCTRQHTTSISSRLRYARSRRLRQSLCTSASLMVISARRLQYTSTSLIKQRMRIVSDWDRIDDYDDHLLLKSPSLKALSSSISPPHSKPLSAMR